MLQTIGVCCQRFFHLQVASGQFEVGQGGGKGAAADRGVKTLEQRLEQMYRAQVARFQARKQGIEGRNNKAEPNAQLQQVGQAKHLAGLDCSQLGSSVKAIRLDKAVLQRIQKSAEQVAERVCIAVLSQGRYAILFKINKKEVYVKLSKLFEGQIEDNIQAGYKEVYCKLLCFIYWTQDQDNNDWLLYKFIEKQGDLFNAFIDAIHKHVQGKDIGRINKVEQQAQED